MTMLHSWKVYLTSGIVLSLAIIWLLVPREVRFTQVDQYPDVYPDYVGVTIPASLAHDDGILFSCRTDNEGYETKIERTREGNTLWFTVSAWPKGSREGITYKPFPIYISDDEIDPYIAYRLIEPGYESWTNISISQRELASYEETEIVTNNINEKGCINCHQFAGGNPNEMLLHSRSSDGGTFFINGDEINKVDFKQIGEGKQATYPAWHPSGRFVAFSSNKTKQCFMMKGKQPIEVYDTESDIILYDKTNGKITMPPALNTKETWETFPCWNTDGSRLYYCAADSVKNMPDDRSRVHYRLMQIDFDAAHGTFSEQPEEVPLNGIQTTAHSVSFPRINGQWLLFTLTDFGTFPIWHPEADLWLLNLTNGEMRPCDELNTNNTESYHSWSSNGKWIVFSSRRDDGRYTRLYLSHFNEDGTFTKPFMLPQEDPDYNRLRLKSYNIPEFIKGKVKPINKP